nr:class II fructose-bisphosphate aldolase [Microbacterium chengjingii]
MLENFTDMLEDARKNKYGIGCINTPNLEYLRALIEAAEEVNVPLIIDHAEVHDSLIPLESMAPYMIEFAKKASVPVAVHVDHGESMNFIVRGLRAGYSSVMYDCSALPLEENIRRVRDFVEMVHPAGVSVEGELGVMPSTLDDTHGGSGGVAPYTDPEAAARFVEETGVDALAVTFGTSHGVYVEEPKVDLDHLRTLDEATGNVPLVMHGSSGVPIPDIQKAINLGVSKVNYYSYLAVDSSKFAAERMAENDSEGVPTFYHELVEEVYAHTKNQAIDLLRDFKNGHE